VPTGVDLEMPARVQAGPGSGDTGRASDAVLVEVESDRAFPRSGLGLAGAALGLLISAPLRSSPRSPG
jgi:hypothetical protein